MNSLLKQFHLRGRRPAAAPIIFLVLVVVLPFWRLTTMQGYVITDDVFTSDIMNDGFPYRYYLSEALKKGELPLWYPHIYGGFPLIARAESGTCYPVNLVLFGLLPPYAALNLVILLTLILAAIGIYFYVREILPETPEWKARAAPALIAAVSFAYSGFMVSHLKHLSMVNTVSLFPLALYLLERSFKKAEAGEKEAATRQLLWFGLVFAMQNLAGHIQTAYYSGLVYGLYFLFRLLWKQHLPKAARRKHPEVGIVSGMFGRGRLMTWFVAVVLLAVGASALQLIPTYELVGLSQRSGGVEFEYAANYSYDASNIKTFLFPYINGDPGSASYKGNSIFWEDYGYVGFVTFALAIVGVVARWRQPHVRFLAGMVVGAFIMVLGPNTPVYEAAFHLVPGMKFFRFPTRFLFVVDAGIAVLAAFGAAHLITRSAQQAKGIRESNLTLAWVLLAVVVADLMYFQMRQNPIVDAEHWRTLPKTVQILLEDSTLYRIYSPGSSEAHKAAFAKAHGWQSDLTPYIEQREFIQPGTNVFYGIFSADGYAQLTPNYIVDIWGDQNRSGLILKTAAVQQGMFTPLPSFLKIMNMFNVKYILSPWPFISESLEQFHRSGGVFMYRNPSVMPRAFLVGSYKMAPNPDVAAGILLSDEFDPAREAIFYEEPQYERNRFRKGTATVEEYRGNEVIVHVAAEEGAILVLSDTYYPGWKAEIDGEETKLLQANLSQRAVVVPAGNHVVRFVFESSTVRLGFWITVCSLLIVTGLIIAVRKKET